MTDLNPLRLSQANSSIDAARAERDKLQSRIDAVHALIDPEAGMATTPFSDGERYFAEEEIRAALRGDDQ